MQLTRLGPRSVQGGGSGSGAETQSLADVDIIGINNAYSGGYQPAHRHVSSSEWTTVPLPRSVMVGVSYQPWTAYSCPRHPHILLPQAPSPQTPSPSNPAPCSPRSLRSDVPIKPVKTYTDPPSSSPAGSSGKKPGAAAAAAGAVASGTHDSPRVLHAQAWLPAC